MKYFNVILLNDGCIHVATILFNQNMSGFQIGKQIFPKLISVRNDGVTLQQLKNYINVVNELTATSLQCFSNDDYYILCKLQYESVFIGVREKY